MQEKRKQEFVEPEVTTYDREELRLQEAFTGAFTGPEMMEASP